MGETIDVAMIGSRLRRTRKRRHLTLQKTSEQTGITVATLSRIERGAAQNLKASTLVALNKWMGIQTQELAGGPKSVTSGKGAVEETPDVVELHLRADKNLTKETAMALANLFRTAYEHCRKLQETKE